MTRILIGGDLYPMGRNQSPFECGDAERLLNGLLSEFENADLSIVNLECPLIRRKSPIDKCGPNLGASVDCVNGLKAMGVDVVGLANNHVMDHGPQGLKSTILALDEKGIAHVGAGGNLIEAREVLIHQVADLRIGVMALAEHEFGIASNDQPGVNPLDIIGAVRQIDAHRSALDRLIVLIHGGREYYRYPSPDLMNTCRFLVEQGAHAVICQHSHCAGCMETYRGAPIVYGQGNFLFDYPSSAAAWHEGMLVCLDTNNDGKCGVRLIPLWQSDGQAGARLMTTKEEDSFLQGFWARSEAIRDEVFVARQWTAFCQENKCYYLHCLHGKPNMVRRLAGKLDLLHWLDSRETQQMRLHMLRCQSHRESLITILTNEAERAVSLPTVDSEEPTRSADTH